MKIYGGSEPVFINIICSHVSKDEIDSLCRDIISEIEKIYVDMEEIPEKPEFGVIPSDGANVYCAMFNHIERNVIESILNRMSVKYKWLLKYEDKIFEEIEISYDSTEMIHVQGKYINTEVSNNVYVRPFTIRRYNVTIKEYMEFQADTGYKLVAEAEGDFDSLYELYTTVYQMSDSELKNTSVQYVSHKDAVEYCKWKNCRLPTEGEWLAASILDWNVIAESEYNKYCEDVYNNPERFVMVEYDITENKQNGKMVPVIRRGPRYYLHNDWRLAKNCYREVVSPEYYDPMTSFRYCLIG